MSENSISKDFLSKENIANLYKQIAISNEYSNLNKQQKDFIINQLIDTMKKVYKTNLELSKINTSNVDSVKKQFNSIVIKQTTELIKNNIKVENVSNDRNNRRTFETINRNVPNPNGIDRPTSSILGKPVIPSQMNVSDNFLKKTTGDLASRLSELENNRRMGTNNNIQPDIPDFLKPTKVGKVNEFDNMPSNIISDRKLEGIGGFDSDNFKKDNLLVDKSKYNDTLSVQDRLKKLEAERGMSVSYSNQTQNSNKNNISDMFSNTIPTVPINQSQPPPIQPPVQNQPPQVQNQNQYQPPPIQQLQIQNQYQSPPVQNQNQYQQINELNQIILSLKQENDFLKSEIMKIQAKKVPSVNTLQLDISKKEPQYNFQFNTINNVLSLKLLSYNLPQPAYNIVENTQFIYKMNDTEYKIYISKGNYNIDNLLDNLNNNSHLLFSVDFMQKVSIKSKDESLFQIVPTLLSYKLGFNNQQSTNNINIITAYRIFDIRMPSKLLLFIRNINSNEPICSLNFNNSSICNLQFNSPLVLSSLQLEFYLEDNTLYNFNDLFYNLSFAIETIG
jgi:hypothetical protein